MKFRGVFIKEEQKVANIDLYNIWDFKVMKAKYLEITLQSGTFEKPYTMNI